MKNLLIICILACIVSCNCDKKPVVLACIVSCNCDKKPVVKETIKENIVHVNYRSYNTYDTYDILPCPICGAKGYLHKAINDIEHPAWTVDCTMYDSTGFEHERVGKYWFDTPEKAIWVWNNTLRK
jgi:hypothetical protein